MPRARNFTLERLNVELASAVAQTNAANVCGDREEAEIHRARAEHLRETIDKIRKLHDWRKKI